MMSAPQLGKCGEDPRTLSGREVSDAGEGKESQERRGAKTKRKRRQTEPAD